MEQASSGAKDSLSGGGNVLCFSGGKTLRCFPREIEIYRGYPMSRFTAEELAYLQTQRLGRLATINKRGEPQVAAVGFHYNPEFDVIDITGHGMEKSQKFRNVARNGLVSFLVDDVQPPWKTRSMEIRGRGEALDEGGERIVPGTSPAFIRIHPRRIIFWDATVDPSIGSRRNVEDVSV